MTDLKRPDNEGRMSTDRPMTMADAAEMLWVVLANVSGGNWKEQTPEWQEAAARWRDNYFAVVKLESGDPGVAVAPPPLDNLFIAACLEDYLILQRVPAGIAYYPETFAKIRNIVAALRAVAPPQEPTEPCGTCGHVHYFEDDGDSKPWGKCRTDTCSCRRPTYSSIGSVVAPRDAKET